MGAYEIMGIAWAGVIVWVSAVIFLNRKIHPGALFLLFFAELWERFSYYGMRALLVYYMMDELVLTGMDSETGKMDIMTGMGYSETLAYAIYAAYGAMVYATPILGGLLAERILGYRKSIFWGGFLMAAGHFAMAFENETIFFIALALLILGNGFFKPNISSFVGKFYKDGDPRRDGGFTIFYMGINVGAFLTPLTCGVIGETEGWHYGFGLAGIGMVLGLIVFVVGLSMGVFGDKGYEPIKEDMKAPAEKPSSGKKRGWFGPISTNEILVYVGSLLAIPLVYLLLNHNDVLDYILGAVSIGGIVTLLVMAFGQDSTQQRDKLFVITILFLFTALFWTFFELAGSAISVFTKAHVDREFFGNILPASMFQSVNPAFIIIFAPLFSYMWQALAKAKLEPPAPLKFAFGVLLLAIGFLILGISDGAADDAAMVPLIYLVLGYLLHTLGELCLSPVGLSLVTKLSPVKLVGFVMGIWFLSSSVAHQAGKFIASETDSEGLTPDQALTQYTDVFMTVGYVALGAAAILFVLSPFLKRWMHGVR